LDLHRFNAIMVEYAETYENAPTSTAQVGTKRNYSELTGCPTATDPANPTKRRRVLNDQEVIALAKEGRFNPKSIILAVEDEMGFCWFRRIEHCSSTKDAAKSEDKEAVNDSAKAPSGGVLEEMSKEEVAQRAAAKEAVSKSILKAAKLRRFTAPPLALQSVAESAAKTAAVPAAESAAERRKRVKVLKRRKVICYEERRERVKKKVVRRHRVLRKKTVQSLTIRITKHLAESAVPHFPPPAMALSVRRWQSGCDPVAAVQEIERSLLEGFVLPLTECYGGDGALSFITRSVLQWLMELHSEIDPLVAAVDAERVRVPLSAIEGPNPDVVEAAEHKDEKEAVDSNLEDEAAFYEDQLAMLERFEQGLCGEIEFTERAQNQLVDGQFVAVHFDFDLDPDQQALPEAVHLDDGGVGGDEFVNAMAAQIDALWSEYAVDLHAMTFKQKQFEDELLRTERAQNDTASLWVRHHADCERQRQWAHHHLVDTANESAAAVGDRIAFSNFVASNKLNDFTEDDTVHCIQYLLHDAMAAAQ